MDFQFYKNLPPGIKMFSGTHKPEMSIDDLLECLEDFMVDNNWGESREDVRTDIRRIKNHFQNLPTKPCNM